MILVRRHGINPKTVAKWRKRTSKRRIFSTSVVRCSPSTRAAFATTWPDAASSFHSRVLVPEQLVFEQIARDRAAVDRDNRSLRAGASDVNGARGEFLATAR